jgi:hypothetical protein
MLELLEKIDLELLMAVIQLAVLVIGLLKVWKKTEQKDRWAFIKAHIPEIHGKVQKVAEATKFSQKDNEFVALMGKALKAFGYLEIQEQEVDAVKVLGSGYHQEFKIARDSGVTLTGDVAPLESEGSELPSTELKLSGLERSPLPA